MNLLIFKPLFMPMAGYSATPLIKKLGIKPDMKLLILHKPANYWQLIEANLSKQMVSAAPADLVHIFAVSREELKKEFSELTRKLPADAVIWVSWYKRSARIPTDITEDVIREIVLPAGWVDVKVCAVSEQWSGLKIVKRLSERGPK